MMRSSFTFFAFVTFLLLATCFTGNGAERKVQILDFGKTKAGDPIYRYVLGNKNGVEAVVINYGAALVSLRVPDRNGKAADIVLGYDSLEGYEQDKSFFGATIGRYGNRIAGGRFTLDGTVYQLPKNDGPNCLHGGSRGDAQVLELTYTSQDGEEGFPGRLMVQVTYTLPAETNELRIDYSATTNKDTVLNLTNHSYFNLSGNTALKILDHQLSLQAQKFTPVDSTLIPTGELTAVDGTPFDFRKPVAIGARINQDNEQLKFGKGYDHNWVLERTEKGGLQVAAEVLEPTSGRVMEVLTTEPGIQFYSGNFLDGTAHGKGGQPYGFRTGFCLETQHYPDSPNHSNFPSTELKPGQTYQSTTVFRFSTRN